MAREILYKKTEEKAKEINEPKTTNTDLIEWLNHHPLINISGLCREAGINRSNFDKNVKIGSIPEKHKIKLENILKKYGLK